MTKRALLVLALPALLLTVLIFGTAVAVAASGGDPNDRLPDLIPWILMVNHTLVFAAFVVLARGEGLTLREVGWTRLPVPRLALEVALGIGLGALAVLFDDVVMDAVEGLFEASGADVGSGGVDLDRVPVVWLVAATVFPFVEETVYRGYGVGIVGRRTSTTTAVAVSCLFFGLLHWGQGTWGIVNTAAIGALYAGVFLWRRNLWSPTVAHMAFNAIMVLRQA